MPPDEGLLVTSGCLDPSTALGTCLVKVSYDEITRILGHQLGVQPGNLEPEGQSP